MWEAHVHLKVLPPVSTSYNEMDNGHALIRRECHNKQLGESRKRWRLVVNTDAGEISRQDVVMLVTANWNERNLLPFKPGEWFAELRDNSSYDKVYVSKRRLSSYFTLVDFVAAMVEEYGDNGTGKNTANSTCHRWMPQGVAPKAERICKWATRSWESNEWLLICGPV